MRLAPGPRKLCLVLHIGTSVGWLGGVAATLALSGTALLADDVGTARSSYSAIESIAWWVLVPLSLGSLGTGLVQAAGSRWGVFQHYWVIVKLVINVLASGVLLLYMQTLERLASSTPNHGDPSPLLHSGAALILLIVALILSVYKPRGLTRYGWRKAARRATGISRDASSGRPRP